MVDFTTNGRIALITIDRPEVRNAINGVVAIEIEAAIDRLEADDALWVGVITGNGPVFCAGADLNEVAAGRAAGLWTERGGFGGITRRERIKPLIAAVNGLALAGGCEVALSCDLIVASTDAGFGIPEVKRSLIAGAGGLFRLPRVLPFHIAMELALTGDSLSAERAHELGLINELCPPGEAVATATELAARICANAPLAVRASREIVRNGMLASDDDAWRMTDLGTEKIMSTEDFAEGPRAFIEKRPPVWTGR